MKRAAVLAVAAGAYLVAAWMVAPGFYDGFSPPQPYNFVCPPPQVGANAPPTSGHLVINVINGVSDADSAYTGDGQIVIGFLPGSFDATGKTSITVDITPVSPCPKPSGLHFATNVYKVDADSTLVKKASMVLRYSNLVADPSFVYRANSVDGPWTDIGASQQAQVWTINTTTDRLGYFAAGYASNAIAPSTGGTSQVLPITVAVLIVAVLVAGIPLSVRRRRQAPAGRRHQAEEDEEDEDDEVD